MLAMIALPASASTHARALVIHLPPGPAMAVVRASGPDSGSYRVNHRDAVAFTGIASLTIVGTGARDGCTIVNPAHGLFAPPGGIACEGGNRPGQPRRGVLHLRGGSAQSSAYRPSLHPGSGAVVSRRRWAR
jgi:hypothetical protein